MTDQNAINSNLEIRQSKKPQYSEEQRQKHCQDYQASKLSIEKYCECHKISQSALRKWIKKSQSKNLFLPVGQSGSINHFKKQSFEVIFSNGIRLRFPELIDFTVIKQLIQEMGACN